MTEHSPDFHRPRVFPEFIEPEEVDQKPVLQFGSWAEEAVYLAVPMDIHNGIHAQDLILRLGHSERAVHQGVGPDDVQKAAGRLVAGGWLSWVGDFLYRTNFERSIVLRFT